jgi:leucyl-tRNA synthetase
MLFAYPTASGNLHVGHARSYTIPDIIARYKRMRGYNVFFPLGFHATGIDCITIYEKINDNPNNGSRYGIPLKEAETLKSPTQVEKYLESTITNSLQRLGLSLDIQPKTSTIDTAYNKFIQWQFHKLRQKGYLIQKDHFLPWCPNCNHPVSLDEAEADISEWKGSTIKEYTIIKFQDREGNIFPSSTLRPETIFGVTNIWLNPKSEYVKAEVNDETWITSKKSIKKLQDQGKKVKIIEEYKGKRLEKIEVQNPITKDIIKVYMAEFVDHEEATGVVMSVPAHDPYDYIYATMNQNIIPIQIIEIEEIENYPAKYIIEKMGINELTDPRLEEAVKELYKIENNGRMIESIERFGGIQTEKARKSIKNFIVEQNVSDIFYELTVKPIQCRCGTEIIVKIISGQWFIDYSNPIWKTRAKECITRLNTFPREYKKQLPEIIDWLNQRPCVRKRGFGTSFPFEKGWMIEALSDSTIYMAFFVVTKYLNKGLIREEQLTNKFFDHIFLNRDSEREVSLDIGISEELLREIRNEFEYWYPLDLNAGGKEHKSVHFPFFIFHHVAIFPDEHWPKNIYVNWHLIAYGEKMSKHLGNVIFLDEALEIYGADTIRLYLAHGSNQWRDFDWKDNECEIYKRHLERFTNLCREIIETEEKLVGNEMDEWLDSVINIKIKQTTDYLKKGEIRKAVDTAFFGIWNDIDWYRHRTNNNIKRKIIETWIKLLSPFIPNICEEIWETIGNKQFITTSEWPKIERKINKQIIESEETLKKTIEDVKHISKLTKRSRRLYIYTATETEFRHLNLTKTFLKKELGFTVVDVFKDSDNERYDPHNRAEKARKQRPGIYLE